MILPTVYIEEFIGKNLWWADTLFKAFWQLGYATTDLKREEYAATQPGIYIWWGSAPAGAGAGQRFLYCEQGWTMDRNHCFQLDTAGTCAHVSWAKEPLDLFGYCRTLKVKVKGDLLVVLPRQYRVREGRVLNFAHHLITYSQLPLRFRTHPSTPAELYGPLRDLISKRGHIWDTNSNGFLSACEGAKAVAIVDSTAGAWALELRLPVLCYGPQVFCHPHVVYEMDMDRGTLTNQVTRDLAAGECSLSPAYIDAMLVRIRQRQWYPATEADLFAGRLKQEFGL